MPELRGGVDYQKLYEAQAIQPPGTKKILDYGEWYSVWPFIDHRGTLLVSVWNRGYHVGKVGFPPRCYLYASKDFGESFFYYGDIRYIVPKAYTSPFPFITSTGAWLVYTITEDDYLRIIRSTDEGATWDVVYSADEASYGSTTPIAEDPHQTSVTLYSARCRQSDYRVIVLKSTDDGQTWTEIDTGYSYTENPYLYEMDAYDGRVDIPLANEDVVLQTTDGGDTWTDLSYTEPRAVLAYPFKHRWLNLHNGNYLRVGGDVPYGYNLCLPGVLYCRHVRWSGNRLFVGYGDRPVRGVYASDDFGFGWRSVFSQPGMGEHRAEDLYYDPPRIGAFGNYVFVGCDQIGTLWRVYAPLDLGKCFPADVLLWENQSIDADDTTADLWFVKGKITFYFVTDTSGNLVIEIYDDVNGTWRTFDTVSNVDTNTLVPWSTTYGMGRVRLRFDTAATVTAWAVIGGVIIDGVVESSS